MSSFFSTKSKQIINTYLPPKCVFFLYFSKKEKQIKQTKIITLVHTYTQAHTHKHRTKQKACHTHTHKFLFFCG